MVAKSLQILISSGDIRPVCGNHLLPCNLSSTFSLSQPVRHRLAIKERTVNLFRRGAEHTVNLLGIVLVPSKCSGFCNHKAVREMPRPGSWGQKTHRAREMLLCRRTTLCD